MDDNDSITTASFIAGGNAFTTTDAGLDDTGYVVGAGLNVLSTQNFGAAVSYDRFHSNNYDTDFVQAKVYFRF